MQKLVTILKRLWITNTTNRMKKKINLFLFCSRNLNLTKLGIFITHEVLAQLYSWKMAPVIWHVFVPFYPNFFSWRSGLDLLDRSEKFLWSNSVLKDLNLLSPLAHYPTAIHPVKCKCSLLPVIHIR